MKSRTKEIRARVKDIIVPNNHRPLNKDKLPIIAASMDTIGLKTPITVRNSKKGLVLVTGRHRLEAARSLGWSRISCLVMDSQKIERQLWIVAENLHRAGLTKLQRADQVERWDGLVKQQAMGAQLAQPGGRQPHDKGISRTAKQLGTTRDDVRRSKKIAHLSRKAKMAVKAAGLADDEAAMLKVAKEPTPERQTKKVLELANRKHAARRRSLLPDEVRQLKALKKAHALARKFKKAWKRASAAVRQKFIKTVLKSTGGGS
jgi:ParB-like chromosome segregation protein Spo0J